METQQEYTPILSVENFKRSLNRIKAGNTEEFEYVQKVYFLTIEQFNALAEAHEFAIKLVK